MPLSTNVSVNIGAVLSQVGTLVSPELQHSIAKALSLANGNGALQANNIYAAKRTLGASASEQLDLNGTALQNMAGQNIQLTKVALIYIAADAGNTNDVVFGPNSTNGFVTPFNAVADRVKVKPNGLALIIAPDAAQFAVTAGTGDLLFVQNGGAGSSVTYDIVIIGS